MVDNTFNPYTFTMPDFVGNTPQQETPPVQNPVPENSSGLVAGRDYLPFNGLAAPNTPQQSTMGPNAPIEVGKSPIDSAFQDYAERAKTGSNLSFGQTQARQGQQGALQNNQYDDPDKWGFWKTIVENTKGDLRGLNRHQVYMQAKQQQAAQQYTMVSQALNQAILKGDYQTANQLNSRLSQMSTYIPGIERVAAKNQEFILQNQKDNQSKQAIIKAYAPQLKDRPQVLNGLVSLANDPATGTKDLAEYIDKNNIETSFFPGSNTFTQTSKLTGKTETKQNENITEQHITPDIRQVLDRQGVPVQDFVKKYNAARQIGPEVANAYYGSISQPAANLNTARAWQGQIIPLAQGDTPVDPRQLENNPGLLGNPANGGVPQNQVPQQNGNVPRTTLSPEVQNKWLPIGIQTAQQFGLDPKLVTAVMGMENASGDPKAVSSQGAVGLMQITPETQKTFVNRGLVKPGDLNDPMYNMQVGMTILKYYSDKYKGDTAKVLAAYHGGEGVADGTTKMGPNTKQYVENGTSQVNAGNSGNSGTIGNTSNAGTIGQSITRNQAQLHSGGQVAGQQAETTVSQSGDSAFVYNPQAPGHVEDVSHMSQAEAKKTPGANIFKANDPRVQNTIVPGKHAIDSIKAFEEAMQGLNATQRQGFLDSLDDRVLGPLKRLVGEGRIGIKIPWGGGEVTLPTAPKALSPEQQKAFERFNLMTAAINETVAVGGHDSKAIARILQNAYDSILTTPEHSQRATQSLLEYFDQRIQRVLPKPNQPGRYADQGKSGAPLPPSTLRKGKDVTKNYR